MYIEQVNMDIDIIIMNKSKGQKAGHTSKFLVS